MHEFYRQEWPWRTRQALAGAVLAAALAGCGGGGGGGGGGTTTPTPPTTVSTLLYPNNADTTIGNATPSSGTAAAQVEVTADAIPAADTQGVTISVGTDASPPSTSGFVVGSRIYDLEPAGQTFQGNGAIITIPYTPSSSLTSPMVFYYNTSSSEWVPVQGVNNNPQTVNTTSHLVSVQVAQFAAGRGTNGAAPTDYAVLAVAPPAPPPP